jgi:hypothetical protein
VSPDEKLLADADAKVGRGLNREEMRHLAALCDEATRHCEDGPERARAWCRALAETEPPEHATHFAESDGNTNAAYKRLMATHGRMRKLLMDAIARA